ncbi:MAG: formamidopyrimidine-DNA glycosylase [Gemmatimonadetes bacterium]|nr:formamidopyrimidine-DNA glycosylase [Gemmatimonadota bacterium]
MPELPDVIAYTEALERHVVGRTLGALRIASPFLVRSVDPPVGAFVGRDVEGVERIGKRIVLRFAPEEFLVIHLMIAGRLRWRAPKGKVGGRGALAVFEFPHGWLFFTEAGTKKRASLTAVRGREALAAIDRGGLEVLDAAREAFAERLRSENHTLKRALTDPRMFSGIGNAYSDEILHHARLSPLQTTARLSDAEVERLQASVQEVLRWWIGHLRAEVGEGFPETVTAFREEMKVHGRYGKPCPDCGAPVQRIRYADNETNYCARCQTDGRLLADRALSRLLKKDWPRSIDELD